MGSNGGAPGGAQPLGGGARAPPGPPENPPLVRVVMRWYGGTVVDAGVV